MEEAPKSGRRGPGGRGCAELGGGKGDWKSNKPIMYTIDTSLYTYFTSQRDMCILDCRDTANSEYIIRINIERNIRKKARYTLLPNVYYVYLYRCVYIIHTHIRNASL